MEIKEAMEYLANKLPDNEGYVNLLYMPGKETGDNDTWELEWYPGLAFQEYAFCFESKHIESVIKAALDYMDTPEEESVGVAAN